MAVYADELVESHLDRMHSLLVGGYDLSKIPKWICDNTRLKGQNFSFKDHEYQLAILNDRSRNVNVRKCSQVGISELSVRLALAEANIIPGFTVMYTLPTSFFSKTFAKTRVDPVIQGSPKLTAAIHTDVDNTEVKQFGESFIYFKGTKGATTAISVPADHLIHDELDFSDLDTVSNYQSRLPHSKYKLTTKFSTPTVEKYGISAEMAKSRRFYNICKCNHCNNNFIPNYFRDVRVSGWDKDLKEITQSNIHEVDYKSARVFCPQCGLEPDLGPAHREWVCENQSGDTDTAGYQITPFDAPNIITAADLVKASTTFERYAEFVNNRLGLPAEDRESAISTEDLDNMWITASGSGYVAYVMGIDIGQMCHLMVAGVKGGAGAGGGIDVLVSEKVPHHLLEKRKEELRQIYPIRITVMDSQPYFDMLIRMQGADPNLWGALFIKSKDLDLYRLRVKDQEEEKGQMYIRQLDINRNRGFDALMEAMRAKQVHIMVDECKEDIIAHCTDMTRLRILNDENEFSYVWRKSEAKNDHFHHTLLYTYMASKLTGMASNLITIPLYIGKIKLEVRP